MKKHERRYKLVLTLIFSTIIFISSFISTAAVAVFSYILVDKGLLFGEIENNQIAARLLIIVIGMCLLAGTLISVFISKIAAQPMSRVVFNINRLASGDFKTRLYFGKPISKIGIFCDVSESFNRMAEELENTEVLRKDFINSFSHEFKTPIISIAGFAKLLKKENISEKQRQEYLDIIEEEAMRLSNMATNILNLSHIENQTILTNTNAFNLSEQIRNCFLMLEVKWTNKNIDFDLDFDEYYINANEELLKHVWINLIDNAIKFTPEYGVVKIKIKDNEEYLWVSVINYGSEIPEDKQDKIFNKFYKCDESRSTEGNGIGLALASKIIKLHSGEITVSSKDNVTNLTVKIPKNPKVKYG